MSLPLVFNRDELPAAGAESLLGGKGANLVRLRAMGQPVPAFYVLTAEAFRAALRASGVRERIDAAFDGLDPTDPAAVSATAERIGRWIAQVTLPPELADAVRKVHDETVPTDGFVAVRSSAADEDGADCSFAGIHESRLFVRGVNGVLDAVKAVWASAYSGRAIAYRHGRNLPLDRIVVAVVVQQMVDARQSGVMFTCDPAASDTKKIVVSSLFGAGEGLVGAGFDADTFTVDKNSLDVCASRIANKRDRLVFDRAAGEGLKTAPVDESRRDAASLTDSQLREVARAGLAIERRFGRPQDVEFCFDGAGRLFILQSRPVVRIDEYGPAAGNELVWDNSNIVESYSGVTSPMTFSFIRRAYPIVYHCFAQVMGISPAVVRANRGT